MPSINFETKKALHENKDDDGFGPTIKKAAKNPDGTEKDKWRTTGGATFEDNIQVWFIRIFFQISSSCFRLKLISEIRLTISQRRLSKINQNGCWNRRLQEQFEIIKLLFYAIIDQNPLFSHKLRPMVYGPWTMGHLFCDGIFEPLNRRWCKWYYFYWCKSLSRRW